MAGQIYILLCIIISQFSHCLRHLAVYAHSSMFTRDYNSSLGVQLK